MLSWGQHVEVHLLLEVVELEPGVIPLGHHGEGDVELLLDLINTQHSVHVETQVNLQKSCQNLMSFVR